MATTDPRSAQGRAADTEAARANATGNRGQEDQALMLRLMAKLWQRFEETAERELGGDSNALVLLRDRPPRGAAHRRAD